MQLEDLPTPCLVLDRGTLMRNLASMARVAARHGVTLRPHMKTAKSIDVARHGAGRQPGGITVSTLAEAEYFAGHGMRDMLYAVGITPQKLASVAALNAAGADITVITDDPATAAADRRPPDPPSARWSRWTRARAAAACRRPARLLATRPRRWRPAGRRAHPCRAQLRRPRGPEMAAIAEAERAGIVQRGAGPGAPAARPPIVSMGSTPTCVHAPIWTA